MRRGVVADMSQEFRFKVGGKAARESIAALMPTAPWYAKSQLANLLEQIDELGIEISIRRARRKHTDEQRGYYHLCLGIFAKHTGYDKDSLHDVVLSEAFGSREILTPSNRVYRVPTERSSKLNVEAYSELIDTLHRVAAFAGCVLPDPETVVA
jgi:hypothetical protein